ncbi:AEC family transporter [bacterium 210820-DFI.6.37]|nr:AEC family transporter [bacterium 210820-DFI.6.37]
MAIIFYKIIITFAMIIIGYICCKTKVLRPEANEHLISLLINVTGPCLIITSIASETLSGDTVIATVQMLLGTLIYFIAGFVVALFIVKLIKVPKEDTGVYTIILTAQNTGFMGFPVSKAAFGSEGLYYMVLNNIMLSIYMYSAGLLQVSMGEKRRIHLKQMLRSMVNMCSIAAMVGIILLFSGTQLPKILYDIMAPVGDANIPVSMIVLGVQLGQSNIRGIIKNRKLAAIAIISLTVWPALTFLAVNWLPLYKFVKLIMVYASAFPTMVMIVAIAAREGKNAQLAAEGVALSTMLSIITLPIVTTILSVYYGV